MNGLNDDSLKHSNKGVLRVVANSSEGMNNIGDERLGSKGSGAGCCSDSGILHHGLNMQQLMDELASAYVTNNKFAIIIT